MPDIEEQLRAWSHLKQRLGEPAASPQLALRAVVAVYATHPTAPLALWARARSFTAARYRRIDRDRKGLRIPAMRGTVFLVPRDHAARAFTAVRPPPARVVRSLKRHGFSTRDYERFARTILAAAQEPLATKDLQDTAGIRGQALGAVLRCLRYEGRLLALAGESMNTSAHRYVATSAWAPEGLDAGDPADALMWLAGEYLRAYGPARIEDFAWWAGIAKGEARKAVGLHDTVDVGDGLLLRTSDAGAFDKVRSPRGTVDLLPKWDPYTMGHAPDGRQRFVHPDVQHLIYTPIAVGLPGDGNPVVLVEGRAAATWTFSLKEGGAVQPFDKLGPKLRRKIDAELDTISGILSR